MKFTRQNQYTELRKIRPWSLHLKSFVHPKVLSLRYAKKRNLALSHRI